MRIPLRAQERRNRRRGGLGRRLARVAMISATAASTSSRATTGAPATSASSRPFCISAPRLDGERCLGASRARRPRRAPGRGRRARLACVCVPGEEHARGASARSAGTAALDALQLGMPTTAMPGSSAAATSASSTPSTMRRAPEDPSSRRATCAGAPGMSRPCASPESQTYFPPSPGSSGRSEGDHEARVVAHGDHEAERPRGGSTACSSRGRARDREGVGSAGGPPRQRGSLDPVARRREPMR